MIRVSKANKEDLNAIRHLSAIYGHKMVIEDYLINKRDIALQARHEDGSLVGFVWCGLMGSNKIGYVDKVMVHPEYSDQGVLAALYTELFKVGLKLGVRQAFGIIRHDQYHDKSAKGALHMAWGADPLPYTHVMADLNHMKAELEAHNGS